MQSNSPYQNLPPNQFWRTGVAGQHSAAPEGLYKKKFEILQQDRIVTAGSCFAQHISRQLKLRGYPIVNREPAPPGLSAENARRFGYDIYSARYGNIYAVRQLLQLTREAFGKHSPAEVVWEKNGLFYDALRPNVEPEGLESPGEVLAHRAAHLRHVNRAFKEADVFIFTLGLTEAWLHSASGTVFPTCPGVLAGVFDPAKYSFKNFSVAEIREDLLAFRNFLKRRNPKMRLLLTVSPVPLVATADGKHVLQATTYSKSALRAAAGEFAAEFADVDYFPSYEIVANPWMKGSFYESDLRSVNAAGVDAVMSVFFSEHQPDSAGGTLEQKSVPLRTPDDSREDLVCEEELLKAFGP